MLFRFDPLKFARQLCPQVLRSDMLVAILRAFCVPFGYISNLLKGFREEVEDTVRTTSHVIVLEGALNDAFSLAERQIYITTMMDLGEVYFYRSTEPKVTYLYSRSEGKTPVYLLEKDGAPPGASFTVHVPDFLATSTDYEEDEFWGMNMATIREIVNAHKPVGKSYSIEIYEYEQTDNI